MKKIDYLIEKERKKCDRLDALYQEYELKKIKYEEGIQLCMEYHDNNDMILKSLDKELDDQKNRKIEYEKNQKIVQKQKEAETKFAQLKQEHFSIKQTYNELLDKKKDLQVIEVNIIDENTKYKDAIRNISRRIQEKKQERINLEGVLSIKIEQAIKLKEYYEKETQ